MVLPRRRLIALMMKVVGANAVLMNGMIAVRIAVMNARAMIEGNRGTIRFGAIGVAAKNQRMRRMKSDLLTGLDSNLQLPSTGNDSPLPILLN